MIRACKSLHEENRALRESLVAFGSSAADDDRQSVTSSVSSVVQPVSLFSSSFSVLFSALLLADSFSLLVSPLAWNSYVCLCATEVRLLLLTVLCFRSVRSRQTFLGAFYSASQGECRISCHNRTVFALYSPQWRVTVTLRHRQLSRAPRMPLILQLHQSYHR